MKFLCKCGKHAHADFAISFHATCDHCGRQWLWYCGPNENDWLLTHEPPAIATLTSQRDRLAEALRRAADEPNIDFARDIADAALAELEKP